MRKVLTVLKDCDPPDTIASPRVRPCVGRTEPVLKGIQSIRFLNTAVFRVSDTRKLRTMATGDLRYCHAARDLPRSDRHSIYSEISTLQPLRDLDSHHPSWVAPGDRKRERHSRAGTVFVRPQKLGALSTTFEVLVVSVPRLHTTKFVSPCPQTTVQYQDP